MSEKHSFQTDELTELLHSDGLAMAEKITGKSYKEDEGTQGLGFLFHMDINQRKRELLESRDDTTFSNTLNRYQRIITQYGFREVLHLPFEGNYGPDDFYVYWHDDGLLLSFDTFTWSSDKEQTVNGGKVRYNWRPNEGLENRWELTSSGHFQDSVWSGDHDCREALIFNLEQLRANGEFINPWVDTPWLWMLHYMDTKIEGYDHKAITAERVAMLPDEVRRAIGV